ncbi:hypothetical protein V8C43DRAFT_100346 [Trichoderma afarasin]
MDLRFSTSKRFCPGVGRASHCVRGIPDEGRDAHLGRTTKGPREVSCCQRHNLPSRHSRFLDAFDQALAVYSLLWISDVWRGQKVGSGSTANGLRAVPPAMPADPPDDKSSGFLTLCAASNSPRLRPAYRCWWRVAAQVGRGISWVPSISPLQPSSKSNKLLSVWLHEIASPLASRRRRQVPSLAGRSRKVAFFLFACLFSFA